MQRIDQTFFFNIHLFDGKSTGPRINASARLYQLSCYTLTIKKQIKYIDIKANKSLQLVPTSKLGIFNTSLLTMPLSQVSNEHSQQH